MAYRQTFGDGGLGGLDSTATSLPAGYTLGEVRWDGTGQKKYRLMYNAGGASIPSNYVVARSFGGVGLYSVTVTTTSETGNTLAAGMNEGTVTIPTASYFWAAVSGHPFKLVSATVSIATDAGVCMEATSGGGKVMLATTPSNNCIALNLGDFASDVTGIATANTGLAGGRFFIMFEDVPGWAKSKVQGV